MIKKYYIRLCMKKIFFIPLLFLTMQSNAQTQNCNIAIPSLAASCSIPGVDYSQLNYSLTKFCTSNTKAACSECKKLIPIMGVCDFAKCIYEQIGRKQGVKYDITYKDGSKDCLSDSLYKSLDLNAHLLVEAPLAQVCGDGLLVGDEVCDDGNTADGDGCCGNCKNPEPGYVCEQQGQPCIRQGAIPPNIIWNCLE